MQLTVRLALSIFLGASQSSAFAQEQPNPEPDFSVLGVHFGSAVEQNPYKLALPLKMNEPALTDRVTFRRSCESFIRRWSILFFPSKFDSARRRYEISLSTSARIGFESNGISIDTSLEGRLTGGWYDVPSLSTFGGKKSKGNVCFIYLDNKLYSIFFNNIPIGMDTALDGRYQPYRRLMGGLYELPNGVTVWSDIRSAEVSYTHFETHFSYLDQVVPLYVKALKARAGNQF